MTKGHTDSISQSVSAELIAVLVAVTNGQPKVITVSSGDALPAGPLEESHKSLQAGLRAWVADQTGRRPGFVEQLYTFADRDRGHSEKYTRQISISYLGLTGEDGPLLASTSWRGWYGYLPWEDRRDTVPALLKDIVEPGVQRWVIAIKDASARQARRERAAIAFGLDGRNWNEDLVLQRYELLFEAGLLPEAGSAGRRSLRLGSPMEADHRRILATGIARLRAKIKYNPVVFELMPPIFTLQQLQQCVEAIAGANLHTPNFRRLIEQQQLVEATGAMVADTGGRPARAYRFRAEVKEERAAVGARLPIARA